MLELTYRMSVDSAYEQYVDAAYLAEQFERWMFYEMDIPAAIELIDIEGES